MFKKHLLSLYIIYFESTDKFIAIVLDNVAYHSDMHIRSAFPTVLKVRISVNAPSANTRFQSGTSVHNMSHD